MNPEHQKQIDEENKRRDVGKTIAAFAASHKIEFDEAFDEFQKFIKTTNAAIEEIGKIQPK